VSLHHGTLSSLQGMVVIPRCCCGRVRTDIGR